MEDRQILALFDARSETAIDETKKKYDRYCRAIAARILENDADAEEVVSDTYLRLWDTIPPNKPSSLKGYIGTLCSRLAINRAEQRNAEKRGGGQIPLILEELSDCVSGSASDIGDTLALRDAIDRFLSALPKRTRIAFVRRYFYLCPIAEIARDCHMKESAVSVMLLRTREKLREFLTKEGFTL